MLKFAIAQTQVEHARWKRGGTTCPCCGSHCEVHRVAFHHSLANEFMQLAEHEDYVHVKSLHNQDHHLAKARYWGLVQQDPKRRGWWKVTSKGRSFAAGATPIAEAVFTYHGEVIGRSVKTVSIQDILGDLPSLHREKEAITVEWEEV